MVPILNGKNFCNQMAFGYQIFYHGRESNGPDHLIYDHLNTEQVKVCYSDKFAVWMLVIQIPTVYCRFVCNIIPFYLWVTKMLPIVFVAASPTWTLTTSTLTAGHGQPGLNRAPCTGSSSKQQKLQCHCVTSHVKWTILLSVCRK